MSYCKPIIKLDARRLMDFLAETVVAYIEDLYFNNLLYVMLEKECVSEDVLYNNPLQLFELPIWHLYKCDKCGAVVTGIPNLNGCHIKEETECGKLLLVEKGMYWIDARKKSTENGIYGNILSPDCVPACVPNETFAKIIQNLLDDIDQQFLE